MDQPSESPLILLHHDGELREVRSLLDSLGIPVRERVGPLRPAEVRASWSAVVASPKRLLEFKVASVGPRPTLVAVADQLSKTLKSQMQRLRVDYVVNRPVHPMALRLLLLHALYNGPERRKRDRVSIGAEIRVRAGLFAKPATLAEISQRGARVLTHQPVTKGARLKLVVGRDLTRSSAMKIPAVIVRATGAEDGSTELGLRFEDLGTKASETLRRFIDLHRHGPVQVRHQVSGAVTVPVTIQTPVRPAQPTPAPVRPVTTTPISEPVDVTDEVPTDESERRHSGRHSYENRVVALVDEAARVFIGRDISTGGMRVDAHDEIGIGSRLKLALHAGPRSEPILVDAIVDRDDGEEGVFLRFVDETGDLERDIDPVIRRVTQNCGDGVDGDLVVSEIIHVEAAPAP